MNKLFLLIPAITAEDAGQDYAYLKLLGQVKAEAVEAILRKTIGSLRLVAGENIDVLYDSKHLSTLMRTLKKKKGKKEDAPHIEDLLLFFNDAVSIQNRKIGNTPFKINGMTVETGLVNAYMEDAGKNALLNKEAQSDDEHPIEVEDMNGCRYQLRPLPNEAAEVYLWLTDNREPERTLDMNYQKHGLDEKFGKRGVKVSALTYTQKQLEKFLKKAVVADEHLRELYYRDNEKDKIIVFWDENLANPSFHAFEIEADDIREIQKMYKRGGRSLIKRIEETSQL